MLSAPSVPRRQDGDACTWLTVQEYCQIQDDIDKRDPPSVEDLHAVYVDVRDALDYGNINFAVIGGYAMNAYGFERPTSDVDFYFNASDEQILGALRVLRPLCIKEDVGSLKDFRVFFKLAVGTYVGIDFYRVPIDLRLESNKNVVILEDRETRTLTKAGLVNSMLRALAHRRKERASTLQDEENIYRLLVGLIGDEDIPQLNRNIIKKELLQTGGLSSDHKQVINDMIFPPDLGI